MHPFVRFLSYNNAVPIALTILISGGGAAFAATNPETIYDSAQTVVAADNTYIANKDLSSFTPRIVIMGVTEDADNYYVAYALTTIDVVDSVWRDVVKERVLTVSKGVLGEYGDLGLYATEQFKQIVDSQLAYLREVQEIERRQVTQKVVATSYSGLVGRFLDESTEVLPGYVPVVTPPIPVVEPPAVEPQLEKEPESQDPAPENLPVQDTPPGVENLNPSSVNAAPEVQMLGENPVQIELNAAYVDLGVVATDDSGTIPQIIRYLDGAEITVEQIAIDTSVEGEHTIRYVATDSEGKSTTAERRVIVSKPVALVEPDPAPGPEPTPEPTAEPTVEPAPEVTAPTTAADAVPPTESGVPAPPDEVTSTPTAE